MTLRLVFLLLALGLASCVDEEVRPQTPELMSAPELSHPREPRMTNDPAPPMREDLKKVETTLITSAGPAPVRSATRTIVETHPQPPSEPGLVNPLR